MEKVGLKFNQTDIINPIAAQPEAGSLNDSNNILQNRPEQFGAGPEPSPQASAESMTSYAEQYKDLELVDVLGNTMIPLGKSKITLSVAKALCPADLSKYSTEQRNDFVVNMLNKRGIEIDSQYSGILNAGLIKLGQEPKFSLKPSTKDDLLKTDTKSETDAVKPKLEENNAVGHEKESQPARLDRSVTPIQETAPKPADMNLAAKIVDTAREVLYNEVEPTILNLFDHKDIESPLKSDQRLKTVIAEAARSPQNEPIEISQDEEINLSPSANETSGTTSLAATMKAETELHSKVAVALSNHETRSGLNTESEDEPHAVMSQEDYEFKASAIQKLEETLSKDESIIAKDFISGVNALIEASISIAEAMGLDEGIATDNESGNSVVHLLNEIVARIELIDDSTREDVNQTIKQLVGALHGKLLLEQEGTAEAEIEYVDTAIDNLLIKLLDSLDVDYNAAAINKLKQLFINTIFLDGMLEISGFSLLDLESVGTREIKRFRKELLSKLTALKTDADMIHRLGLMALARLIVTEFGVDSVSAA